MISLGTWFGLRCLLGFCPGSFELLGDRRLVFICKRCSKTFGG